MKAKKMILLASIGLTALSSVGRADSMEGSWSWKGVTRNEERIQQAAYNATCGLMDPSHYTNFRLEWYVVDDSKTTRNPFGSRTWEGWGRARCVFEKIVVEETTTVIGGEELPDLNCTHVGGCHNL